MKRLFSISLIALAFVAPVASFAQTANGPVTRAQVHAEVVAAERNGTLHQSKVHYPSSPQTATPDATAYGAPLAGSSQSSQPGSALSPAGRDGLYLHR